MDVSEIHNIIIDKISEVLAKYDADMNEKFSKFFYGTTKEFLEYDYNSYFIDEEKENKFFYLPLDIFDFDLYQALSNSFNVRIEDY